jgi:hypothetical protein
MLVFAHPQNLNGVTVAIESGEIKAKGSALFRAPPHLDH